MKIYGRAIITLQDGERFERIESNNLIVGTGRIWCMSRWKDIGGDSEMTHMAIGTGSNPTLPTDTNLRSEVARTVLTSSDISTVSADQMNFVATFLAGLGTGDIVEAGIFNAASGGTMLNRVTFPVQAKSSVGRLDITWAVRIGAPPVY